MGPPTFIGGESAVSTAGVASQSRFNGAADVHRRRVTLAPADRDKLLGLQWGRRRSSAESAVPAHWARVGGDRFNGAADVHRRRGRSSRIGASFRPGFNGAADVHRRREWTWLYPPHKGSDRLQWGRRRSSAESSGKFTRRRFTHTPLQWGRRRSSAERGRRGLGGGQGQRASMGPPTFIGGESTRQGRTTPRLRASMGPPTFIGGEPPHPEGRPYAHRGFNGAADVHRRRVSRHHQWGPATKGASMGPPTFIGGERDAAATSPSWPASFNGAADVHRRRGAPAVR